MITRPLAVLMWVSLTLTSAWAQTGHPIYISAEGWTVTANAAQSTLTVSHNKLRTVLEDVRLNLRSGGGLHTLEDWTIQKAAPHQLSIRTKEPRTAWLIVLAANALRISCTSGQTVLTAKAPASSARIVARLMDRQGIPVEWEGTREVEDENGGKQTRHQSFLPQRNPECMHFGLGPVSDLNLHSLFEGKSDIAIRFSGQTRIRRDHQDDSVLDIATPAPANTIVRLIPHYYTKVLGVPYYVPFDDSHFAKA